MSDPVPTATETPKPSLTVTEQLMHATIRIECVVGQDHSIGTGFLFQLFRQGSQSVPVIVTNKHVVRGGVSGSFQLTLAKEDGTPDLAKHIPVDIPNFQGSWLDHPDPNVDLTICPCASILQDLEKSGRKPFWVGLDQSLIPTDEQLLGLTPVENILVVGYPIGIWDNVNNTPVFRRGITATSPALDFQGKKEFLIDAAIFPGSSGSPVLLFDPGTWMNRQGNVSIGTRIMLLGINFAVATYTATGEIQVLPAPTQFRPVPVLGIPGNLGICIKASRILEVEPILVSLGLKPPDGYIMRSQKK